jgi:hypothetical protein
MEKIIVKIYDSESKCLIPMLVKKDNTIGSIKEHFITEKKQCIKTNIIAYDSFNKSFNIMSPLADNISLEALYNIGFSFKNDYIIFEYEKIIY